MKYPNYLAVHIGNCDGGLLSKSPKPSRFRRLLWVCQEIVGAVLTVALAIIVPVAIYLVIS